MNHNIGRYSRFEFTQPNRLAQTALHAIALDCATEHFAHRITHPPGGAGRVLARNIEHRHMRGEKSSSLAIDSAKIRMAQ